MREKKKVVFFGGGAGMPTLFSVLKNDPWIDIHAVVTMFDSGGSSGVLRDRWGILPPSDILRCLMALGDDEMKSIREMLLQRIPLKTDSVQSNPGHPIGHTAGNLMFKSLMEVYGVEGAVAVLSGMFRVKGHVYPVALELSHLMAEFEDGSRAENEVAVDKGVAEGGKVEKLFLSPAVSANPAVIEAIRAAEAFCITPGSFNTSIMPNFLPLGVAKAIRESGAPVVFILNLVTEGRGMNDMCGEDFLKKIAALIGRTPDRMIVNTTIPAGSLEAYAREGKRPISIDHTLNPRAYVFAEFWKDGILARHDPHLLSYVVSKTIQELT